MEMKDYLFIGVSVITVIAIFLLFRDVIKPKLIRKNIGTIVGFLGALGCFGTLIALVIAFISLTAAVVTDSNPEADKYDPPNYNPSDNYEDSNPGYHQVDGYYRSDGTYVEPYIRSNPDGIESNNINP